MGAVTSGGHREQHKKERSLSDKVSALSHPCRPARFGGQSEDVVLSGGLAPGRREGDEERGETASQEERALKHKHPVKDRLMEAFHRTLAASTLFWRPLPVDLHTSAVCSAGSDHGGRRRQTKTFRGLISSQHMNYSPGKHV